MEDYIFVQSSDDRYVDAIYKILFSCGLNMAKQGLFHWVKPYSKSAIRNDCNSKHVVLVKDSESGLFTSTFQMYIDDKNNLYVRKIATSPKYEGKGIGKKNMKFMEDYAKSQACSKICLDVYKRSLRAIGFYKKVGFSIVGETKARFFSEYKMEKTIN